MTWLDLPEGKVKVCTLEDIAKLCGVTVRSVKRWKAAGKLPNPVLVEKGRSYWTPTQAQTALRWWLERLPPTKSKASQ